MAAGAKTVRRRRASYPVANLRAEVAGLEAAMAEVMARPRKEAVHRLRTETRKIEAHLAVMAELAQQEPGFKAIERQAARVMKLLVRIRRAAGRVRDLDVQRRLAKECAAGGATRKVRREAKDLRAQLKVERQLKARDLLEKLEGRRLKLETRPKTLLEALEPVATVGMSAIDLEVLTRTWYQRQVSEAGQESNAARQMHRIRKAAKLARYMAENGLAARVVAEFAAVQEAGGRWHDWLDLLHATRQRLGKRSGLAARLKEQEAAARSSFQALADS